MGIDCSLFARYENGVRQFYLDRLYAFQLYSDKDFINKWMSIDELNSSITNLLRLDTENHPDDRNRNYRSYWQGVATGILTVLKLDEKIISVAIVSEQNDLYTNVYLNAEKKIIR